MSNREAIMIYKNTGEVAEDGVFITNKQLERNKNYRLKQEEKDIRSIAIKNSNKGMGSFIWVLFNYTEELFPELQLSDITKLFIISTYISYDGYLKFDNGKYINKDNLNSILELKENTYKLFYKRMIECEIMTEKEEKRIYLNSSYFIKGDLDQLIINNNDVTRMYVNTIRLLYKQFEVKSHKQLGYLFKLVPYINIDYNILCINPMETELKKIKKINLGDLCELLHYNKENSNRLYEILCNINTGTNKHIISFVSNNKDKREYKMFINPNVFYAGSKWNKVEILGEF